MEVANFESVVDLVLDEASSNGGSSTDEEKEGQDKMYPRLRHREAISKY